MKWAFIDYENTGSLEGIDTSKYQRILIFCGPKNTRVKIGELPASQFVQLEILSVPTSGPNNLDFHLAFHLGCFHEKASTEVEFHIISNDCGFNGLTNHLKQLGRTCKRVIPKKPAKLPAKPYSDHTSQVIAALQKLDGRKRPRKQSGLINWIASNTKGFSKPKPAQTLLKEMEQGGKVLISDGNVTYSLKKYIDSHTRRKIERTRTTR